MNMRAKEPKVAKITVWGLPSTWRAKAKTEGTTSAPRSERLSARRRSGRPSQARNSPRVLVVVLACLDVDGHESPRGRVGAHDPLSAKLLSRKGRVVSEQHWAALRRHEDGRALRRRDDRRSRPGPARQGDAQPPPRGDHRGRLATPWRSVRVIDIAKVAGNVRRPPSTSTSRTWRRLSGCSPRRWSPPPTTSPAWCTGTGPTTRAGRRPSP